MYSCNVKHFTYGHIPGSGKGWTLDVCAIGRRDADTYIRNAHHSGKFIGENIQAMCGATTQAAQDNLRDALERWLNETE